MAYLKKNSILLLFLLPQFLLAQSSPFDSVHLLLQERVYFDFGKYDLADQAVQTLQTFVDSCENKLAFNIHIESHTDDIGTNENNLRLSRNRGEAVKSFFIEKNIAADRITTSVFGEARPVADNTSDDGRQENRRAAVSLFYKKEMTVLKGQIVDKKTGEGMQAKIIFHTKSHKDSLTTGIDGKFEKAIEANTVVGVDIYKKGYFFETQMLKAKVNGLAELTIPLLPVAVGEKVAIKNLYFVGNKAILLPHSEPELPKILKFMELNPDIKVEISGHINAPFRKPHQIDRWQWNLSTDRAKTVYDFLLKNKISEERMEFKGYGNAEMPFPQARNEREQSLNRRVEIRILDTGKAIGELEPLDKR